MNTQPYVIRLRTLLDRYYAGETSPGEERELRTLLAAPDLPEEFHADRETVDHLASVIPPEGFDKRLEAKIDFLAAAERRTAAGKHRFSRRILWGAAASLLVGLGFGVSSLLRPHALKGSDLTPEETYAQTEMALAVFSNALNRGYDGLLQAEATTENATQKAFGMLGLLSVTDSHDTN